MRKKDTNCLSEASFCDRLRQMRNEGSQRPSFWAAFLLLLILWPAKKRRIPMAKPINFEPAQKTGIPRTY
jgi:hypothetical protein